MEGFNRKWKLTHVLFTLVILWIAIIQEKQVRSSPVDKNQASLFGGPPSTYDEDKFPVMVPVSSTVIPLTHLFGRPKPIGGSTTKAPKRNSALFLSPERRARLLERSSRPDTPVRLITKNSRTKDVNNETY